MLKQLRSETAEVVGIDVSHPDKFWLLAQNERGLVRRHIATTEAALIVFMIKSITFVGRIIRRTY